MEPKYPNWGPGAANCSDWWGRLGRAGELRRMPTPQGRQVPAYQETVRELGRALHGRMPALVGREREIAEVSASATSDEDYRWLVGGAYAGKTSLTYELVIVWAP